MNTTSDLTPDSELLARFVRQRDESAFAQLVRQYQPLVIGAALRRTGNLECAKEVAQTVFITLARRASLLLDHRKLAGWLYQAASYQGARVWQAEQRRQRRQEEAMLHEARDEDHAQWEDLESALHALSSSEREAILLHYFQDRSYAEMAGELGLNEAAVRKRVSRAVQTLGTRLQRRGTPVSVVAMLTGAAAVQSTAPVQASMAGAALAASAEGTSIPLMLTLTAMTTNTFIKATVITLALTAVPLAWQQAQNAALRQEITSLKAVDVSSPSLPASGSLPESDATLPARVASAQQDLAALRKDRAAEEVQLATLRMQARQLQEEVVVSFGRLDDVARRLAEVQRLTMDIEAAHGHGDAAKESALAKKFMPKFGEMALLFAEMKRISAQPAMNARLNATTTATLAGVNDQVRDQMERLLLPHFQSMLRAGLTLDKRPAQHADDWDRRFGAASAAAMRSIEHLVPVAKRQTSTWQDAISPTSGFLEMLIHAFPTPPPPPKP